jgi:DNA-binding response OmpR family regulator
MMDAPSQKRILVVEDDRTSSLAVAAPLRKLGYEVEVGADASQAAYRVRVGRPDLIILELGLDCVRRTLPGQSGIRGDHG